MMLESQCPDCNGTGAKKGSGSTECYNCRGSGMETSVQGPFMMRQTCRVCNGSGRVIKDKCGTCHGEGRIEQLEEVQIEVPAGISENERVRIMAHGHEIYVRFQLQDDHKFRRDGYHIRSDVNISVAQAVLGGTIMVDTLEKPEQIVIPPGTSSETIITLSRKGSHQLGNPSYRGDHHVHIQIKPPKRLTEAQREAILEFAKDENFAGTINEEQSKGFFNKIKDKAKEFKN